jgi:hypothetical protein
VLTPGTAGRVVALPSNGINAKFAFQTEYAVAAVTPAPPSAKDAERLPDVYQSAVTVIGSPSGMPGTSNAKLSPIAACTPVLPPPPPVVVSDALAEAERFVATWTPAGFAIADPDANAAPRPRSETRCATRSRPGPDRIA